MAFLILLLFFSQSLVYNNFPAFEKRTLLSYCKPYLIIEKANIVTENTLAGSAIAKNTLGKNWGEPFAFIVPKPLTFHAGIKAVKKIQDEGGLTRGYAITWELYRFLNGLDINIQAVKDETFFVIDDETIDIDTEEELQKLLNKIK